MSFLGDLFAGKAAQAASNYNAKILEENAKAKDAEAKQTMSVHNDYNLPQFDKTVDEIQGGTRVAFASGGVAFEGTPMEVLYEQALNLERDRDNMTYNAENKRDKDINEGIMLRAEANLSRWQGKVAKKASYYAAGKSLLGDYSQAKDVGMV